MTALATIHENASLVRICVRSPDKHDDSAKKERETPYVRFIEERKQIIDALRSVTTLYPGTAIINDVCKAIFNIFSLTTLVHRVLLLQMRCLTMATVLVEGRVTRAQDLQ